MTADNHGLARPAWLSIREAATYLAVGEPTIYRWMKEGRITYRKVGDSTRFLQEDLDAVVRVFPSERDAVKVGRICAACHHDELVEGQIRSTGLVYFKPKKARFWTFQDSSIPVLARMCTRCGAVLAFGDTAKLTALRKPASEVDQEVDQDADQDAGSTAPAVRDE